MLNFIVLFRQAGVPFIFEPLAFPCRADNADHAEEQCENVRAGCEIVWVYLCHSENDSVEDALMDWYSS